MACAVESWLTGRRLVSLPFSDHCEPLVDDADERSILCRAADRYRAQRRWKYVEIRPRDSIVSTGDGYRVTQTFSLHRLDLRPEPDVLLRSFHKDSVQRKIRRAERERLTYEEGRDPSLLRRFCDLLELTRRRHGVPPQPASWFENLVGCLGAQLSIRIASKDGRPAAGVLTLTHGRTIVYKYGGSDARLNALGGTPLLFWKMIQEAKAMGVEELDLGRSDADAAGLIAFKDHWTARRSTLTYWRSPGGGETAGVLNAIARRVFARLPSRLRQTAGNVFYRHLG